ncbi:MAG: hypothetical protein NTX08_01245 [Sphingobacteriales bacterium]|jgi:hypothetical protein|nr:hypothetical protein [Sphingobacteriales bacterium]
MGMDDDSKDFLVRIVQTISMIVLWMMVNIYVGVYKNYAFFEGSPNWTNLLYYAVFLITLALLIRYIIRKWNL